MIFRRRGFLKASRLAKRKQRNPFVRFVSDDFLQKRLLGGTMRRMLLAYSMFFLAGSAWAVGSGGFANQVVGTKALGMGNAFTAVADDPSAIFFNPAGIVQLDGGQVSLGIAPHYPKSKYTSETGNSEMSDYTPVVPNLYSTWRFPSERWGLGVGIFSSYGLKTVWPSDGPLRYVATDSSLQITRYSPVVGYQVNDWLMVGGGLIYTTGKASLKSAVNVTNLNYSLNPGPITPAPDGEQELEGDGDGVGANVGILLKPTESQSFAIDYRSDVKIDIKGKTHLRGLSAESAGLFGGQNFETNTKTSITLPPSVTIGYAYSPNKWIFSIDGEWVGYSSFRDTTLEFSSESDPIRLAVLGSNNPVRHEYKDKWSVGAGTNYQWNDRWQSRAGYYYLPASVGEATWEPSIPDSATHGINVGGSWSSKPLTLDFSYSYLKYQPRSIKNSVGAANGTTVNGNYKTSAQIISINATYRFKGKI